MADNIMFQDFMRDEIEEIPILLTKILKSMKKFPETNILGNIGEFWFAGSGDSHCASLYASSAEFMGEFWFRERAKVVIECGFVGFLGAETVRFSGDQF